MRTLPLLGVLLFSVGIANTALALGADDAEAHIEKGLELRRSGRDADALEAFEKAYSLSASPRAQAQIGLAQMAIGLFEKSESSLQMALQATTDKWITKQRPLLEKMLDEVRNKLGTLEVNGQPLGAVVEVDGQDVDRIPCSVRLHAGEVAVRVKSSGYVPILRTVEVVPRGIVKERFALVRKALAEAEPRNTEPRVADVSVPLKHEPDDAPGSGRSLRVAGAAIAVVGVASMGVGAYFGYRASTLGKDVTGGATFDPQKDRAGKNAQTIEIALLAGGAALLGTGGVLYWLGLREGEAKGAATVVVPVATPTSFALALSTRWP